MKGFVDCPQISGLKMEGSRLKMEEIIGMMLPVGLKAGQPAGSGGGGE